MGSFPGSGEQQKQRHGNVMLSRVTPPLQARSTDFHTSLQAPEVHAAIIPRCNMGKLRHSIALKIAHVTQVESDRTRT